MGGGRGPFWALGKILGAVLLYGLVVLLAYAMQRALMYYPETMPFDPREIGLARFALVQTPVGADGALRHWYAPPARAGAPTVVFFQGNTGSLERRVHKYAPWVERGLGVFLVGYRGYGNPGRPSEAALYADGHAALTALFGREDAPERVVYYGESLGTGLAVEMAGRIKPAGLILEAPFTSMAEAGAHHYPYLPVGLLIKDRYATIDKIKGLGDVPLLLLHGQRDKTVPFSQGKRVFEAYPGPKTAFFSAEAGHNDLYDFGAAGAVAGFLDDIEAPF